MVMLYNVYGTVNSVTGFLFVKSWVAIMDELGKKFTNKYNKNQDI